MRWDPWLELLLERVAWEEEDSEELVDSVDVSLSVELDLEVLESEESEESEVDVNVDVETSRKSLDVSSEGVLSLRSLLSLDSVGDVGSGSTTISCGATLAR